MLRRSRSLLAMFTVLLAAACGDDDPAGPGSGIAGTWESGGSYVRITSDEMHFFGDLGACFGLTEAEIVDRDGDVYTIAAGSIEFEVQISRSGDNLIFSDFESETVFEPSNVDVDELEICETPELPACASLPELEFGSSDVGDLEESDPIDEFGAHFDLYRITIDGTLPDPVVVEMNADFDTYLYVFDADGSLVAENDDWDAGTDSRIDLSEPNGCYIVKATSFDFGVTGAYEVSFY